MKKPLVPMTLLAAGASFACSLLIANLPAMADGGRIGFHGAIVESTCPSRDDGLDCLPEQRATAVVRSLDLRAGQEAARPALIAYALQRDPAQTWRLVEVTYR